MQLILWRHADAFDASAGAGDARQRDMARELTTKGEKQARKTAEWLRARLPAGAVVLASPAVRAWQTAQQLTSDLVRCEAIAPDLTPQSMLDAAGWPDATDRVVVVVSHQPTLGRVASLLLTGRDQSLGFGKSAAWWLEPAAGDGPGQAKLRAAFDAALL